MVTRKTAPRVPPVVAPPVVALDALFVDQADDDTPETDRIMAMVGGLADGEIKVNVYRVTPGRSDVFLCDMDPSEFSLSTLQAGYGAGTYRVRVYEPADNGRPSLKLNRKFELGEPLRGAARAPDVVAESATAREVRELRELVMGMRAQPAAPPADPLATMRTVVEMMTLIQGAQPKAVPSGMDPASMIALMREMKSFGEELADGRPPEKPQSELGTIATALGGVLQAITAGRQAGMVPPDADPRQLSSPDVPAVTDSENEMQMMMRMALGRLLEAATKKTPPAEVADSLMGIASDELILSVVEPDNWFVTLVTAMPEAGAHAEYFAALRAEILSRYDPEQGGAREGSSGGG